ncbi:RNA polymerase sigma factor [Marinobacter antarcticus]|nr:sigma-70 family RNA polymerase sigma factor [Marinobacter antarcticus]
MEDSDRLLPSNNAHEVMADVYEDFRRFLTRRLGDKDEAADVLHDFYVKVLTRIGDVREKEKLRAWMRRVLETSLIDYYRAQSKKRQSEKKYCYLELASLDNNVEDDLNVIDCTFLYKLLPTLKPSYTEILWRAELIGEPRKTIAAAFNISESNLRVRLHRAREALRKRLEETCQGRPIQLRWNGSLSSPSST